MRCFPLWLRKEITDSRFFQDIAGEKVAEITGLVFHMVHFFLLPTCKMCFLCYFIVEIIQVRP